MPGSRGSDIKNEAAHDISLYVCSHYGTVLTGKTRRSRGTELRSAKNRQMFLGRPGGTWPPCVAQGGFDAGGGVGTQKMAAVRCVGTQVARGRLGTGQPTV